MTRSDAIQCYCRQVEHWIDLPKKRRRELLSGLRRELEDAYPPAEALTVAVIHRETGSPCEIAGSLVGGHHRRAGGGVRADFGVCAVYARYGGNDRYYPYSL